MTYEVLPEGYQTEVQEAQVFISRAFEPGENPDSVRAAGDVLPRTCIERNVKPLGGTSCQDCVYYKQYPAEASLMRVCSERNLVDVIEGQEISTYETVVVSVTGNGVGFYDQIQDYEPTINEFGGYEQVKGMNAFFGRKSELTAIGGRLGDCGHLAIEFDLPDGDLGFGFIHITRDNMQGVGAESFGDGEDKKNYVAHALEQAAQHYGVEVADMRVKLTAAINHLFYTFADTETKTAEQVMDEKFAGWFDMGLLDNQTNPNWKRGDPIDSKDNWYAHYHKVCEHLVSNSGVSQENIDLSEILDTMVLESGHASNVAAAYGKRPHARDLYLVVAR